MVDPLLTQSAKMSGIGLVVELIVPISISASDEIHKRKMMELYYCNTSNKPQCVHYDTVSIFFTGFRLGRTVNGKKRVFQRNKPHFTEKTDIVDAVIEAGERVELMSFEIMEFYEQYDGSRFFGDGDFSITFQSNIAVDGQDYSIELGPLYFQIDVDRNWEDDEEKYNDSP